MLLGIGLVGYLWVNGVDVLVDWFVVGSNLYDYIDYVLGYEMLGMYFLGQMLCGNFKLLFGIFEWLCKCIGLMIMFYVEVGGFVKMCVDFDVFDVQFYFVFVLFEDYGWIKVKVYGFFCYVCVLCLYSWGMV